MDNLSTGAVIAGVAVVAGAAALAYSSCASGSSTSTSSPSTTTGGAVPTGTKLPITLDAVPRGTMQEVKVSESSPVTVLLVHTAEGNVYATSHKCPHYGAPLAKGVLAGDRVVCPWHAACFNACTGDIEDGPVLDKLATFPTTVTPAGDIYVTLPVGPVAAKGVTPAMARRVTTNPRHFVIIGTGPAGLAAAETLRHHGFTGAITMLSGETSLPYDRPKLSKNMAVTGEDVLLRKKEFFAANDITVQLGVTVTSIRPASHEVLLKDGAVIKYDKVLCATGGIPRTFRAPEPFVTPGSDLGNILPLRDLTHSAAIVAAVAAAGSKDAPIVIVGSSFIGMEAAAYLAVNEKCSNITVLGMENEPFERVLGLKVGAYMRQLFESKGIKFVLGPDAAVAKFHGSGAVESVTLKNGSTLPATVVIIGAGIIPSTSYLTGVEGVTVLAKAPGGVEVDEHMATGAVDVYAAGDVAYFPYKRGGFKTRIEHWDVAYDQGRVAARSMLGQDASYDGVPFFWTQSIGKSLRYAGHCHVAEDIIIHGSMDGGDAAFVAYYVSHGTVAGVATVGKDPLAVAAMELLRLGAMPTPAELKAAPGLDLAAVLRERSTAHPTTASGGVGAGAGATGVETRTTTATRRHGAGAPSS